jgi:hypothetical protein
MPTRMSVQTFEHFVEVARLIAGDKAPEWLPRLLHFWMGDVHRARLFEQARPTRSQMRERLSRFEAASSLITEELESPWVPEFLEVDPYDPLPNLDQIIGVLEDLAYRANRAGTSVVLANEAGTTKAGSGRARPATSVSAQTYCAMIILETWKFIHGVEPLPKSGKAEEAAEAYWRTAGGRAHRSGDDPFASWRYHFRLAREGKAKAIVAEYRRHLVENDRSWKLLHGFLEEAA